MRTQARSTLIERYLPLARALALRYRGSPEEIDDLVQVASLGLVKAVDRWDPDRGSPSLPSRCRRSSASFDTTSATAAGASGRHAAFKILPAHHHWATTGA